MTPDMRLLSRAALIIGCDLTQKAYNRPQINNGRWSPRMPLSYSLPEGAAGMLVLTLADHANHQFVDLAAWSFTTEAELGKAWASVPELSSAEGESAFLLDRHTREGCDANKYVAASWVEDRCGISVGELILSGRATLSEWMDDFRAHHSKRAA
jgi:hypothetical protein